MSNKPRLHLTASLTETTVERIKAASKFPFADTRNLRDLINKSPEGITVTVLDESHNGEHRSRVITIKRDGFFHIPIDSQGQLVALTDIAGIRVPTIATLALTFHYRPVYSGGMPTDEREVSVY